MTWSPIDLSVITDEVANGIISRPEPSILTRDDGTGLLYPGMVNGVHGESGSGKTWLALHACAEQIAAGHSAAYIDHEGDPRSIVARLLNLGLTADQIVRGFLYSRPEEAARADDHAEDALSALVSVYRDADVTLVVVDSTGEGLALAGARPNADEEVATWFREVPRRIADAGPAVLLLDHSAKAPTGGLWPIGSQRKRAAINGAQYYIETLAPFNREQAGAAKLICAKDRHGNFTIGQKVAELHVIPGDCLRIALRAPAPVERAADGGFRPTVLMERVSAALEHEGPMTSIRLEREVAGRREAVRRALKVLIEEGYVARTTGPRGAHIHTLKRPFTTSPRTPGEVIFGDFESATEAGARSATP